MSFTKVAAAGIETSGTVVLQNVNLSGIITASQVNVGTGGTIITTTTSGRVGIGTTNPGHSIQLNGGTATTLGFAIEPSGWNGLKHRFTVPTSGNTSVISCNYNGSAVDDTANATSSISIGVGQIKLSTNTTNTAPIDRLLIDSSGRVTMPYQPSFTVYNNGVSALVSGATITYNTERMDTTNSMNPSTGLFTAPVTGVYFFSFQALAEINNTSLIEVFFRKNGAALNYTRAYDAENIGTPYGPTVTITTIENLAANDTMSVYLNSGSFHGNMNTQFCGYLIG